VKRTNSLKARYEKSFETKDSGSGSSVFKFPSDTKFFKPKEARNRIIIVPYVVKSKNHPLVHSGAMEIGDIDYLMDVYIHRGIGPGEVDVVCLKDTYHKACPVCEQAKEFKDKGMEKEYKKLKSSRRVLYNVYNARKMDAGLQVFSTSHYLFEKELIDEASSDSDGKSMVDFAGVDDGKIVSFRGAMTKLNGNEYMEYEESISFDEVMNIRTYDEMSKILYGQDGMDDDEPRSKPRGSKAKPRGRDEDDEDDGSDEDEDEDESKAPSRRSKAPSKSKSDDDEEEEDEDEDEKPRSKAKAKAKSRSKADEEEEEDEDEDQKPVTKTKPTSKAKSKSKADEDEDEDIPFDKEDKKKPASKSSKTDTCPSGYVFGTDFDSKGECDKCKVWDLCSDAKDEMGKKKGK
jgi:hypothetical protein